MQAMAASWLACVLLASVVTAVPGTNTGECEWGCFCKCRRVGLLLQTQEGVAASATPKRVGLLLQASN